MNFFEGAPPDSLKIGRLCVEKELHSCFLKARRVVQLMHSEERRMKRLQASHGTSKQCADSIQSQGGFQCSSGSLGRGAYFWGEEEYLEELAEAWAQFRFSEGCYGNHDALLILLVEITVNPNRVFDIDKKVKLAIAKLMHEKVLDTSNIEEISETYDIFIRGVEKKIGRPFKVIKGEVPLAPKKYFKENFPYAVLGQATCYAVVDREIIKIKGGYGVRA